MPSTPSDPEVSIVMPFRNAASTIEAAWRSIESQTLSAWELLAIDDRSIDDGGERLQRAADGDPRVRILHAPRAGLVAALQHGCEAARAPLVARMDADDEMRPHRLERQAEMLAADPGIGVVSSLVEFGGDPQRAKGYAHHVEWANSRLSEEQIRLGRFIDSPLPHPSVAFRRSLLERLGGYREGPFPEDLELWLRWIAAGVRIAKVPEVLLRWNDPPARLSRRDPRYAAEQIAPLRCEHLAAELARRGETREVWLWGSGRVTRRRFDSLLRHGVRLAGFIDIAPNRIGRRIDGLPVAGPGELPPASKSFILSGVGVRGAREQIEQILLLDGRIEGEDFLLAG